MAHLNDLNDTKQHPQYGANFKKVLKKCIFDFEFQSENVVCFHWNLFWRIFLVLKYHKKHFFLKIRLKNPISEGCIIVQYYLIFLQICKALFKLLHKFLRNKTQGLWNQMHMLRIECNGYGIRCMLYELRWQTV